MKLTKELLGEVLHHQCILTASKYNFEIKDNELIYYKLGEVGEAVKCSISLDTLQQLVKRWAFNKWYDIESSVEHSYDEVENDVWKGVAFLSDMKNDNHNLDRNCYIEEFSADSEPEAVFKACQWVLESSDE